MDFKTAEKKARRYVCENPGRTALIAAGVGAVMGSVGTIMARKAFVH